jgi:hypothetical protein
MNMTPKKVVLKLVFVFLFVFAAQGVSAQEPMGAPMGQPAAAAGGAVDEFDSGLQGLPGTGESAGLACDQERCQRAGNVFLITCGVVDAAAILLAFLFWWLATWKLWWNRLARLLVMLLLGAGAALVVIALNPFAGDVLKCCLASGDLARYVLLSEVAPWPRGLVAGAAPTAIGFILLLILIGIVRKLRGR